MKIISPSYKILTPISENGKDELKRIEQAARVCYKSENRITETSAKSMVKNLIKNGHEAMLEHSQLSVLFTVDRGVSHEIVRHRLASMAQESTRYCNYGNDKFGNEITVIDICGGLNLDKKTSGLERDEAMQIYWDWESAMKVAERYYFDLLKDGVSPQIARSVLPNSLKTELVMTANYREWRHFFKLRTAKDAHPQMREVTIPLLKELKEKIPVIFDDIEV